MATPEQNTLLALQLFGQPAQQFNAQNDARTALALKIALAQKEEENRRQLAAEQNQRYLDVVNLQSKNAQELADKTAMRNDTSLHALQTREDAKAAAAETKQLHAAISTTYPKYAAQASALGEEVKPISEFETSWDGLGVLQAEMARLEQTRIHRDQDAAATSAVGELDDAARGVAEQKTALQDALKPHPEDISFAKTHAIQALQTAIENGTITSAPKSGSTAAKKGIAALSRGDTIEAGSLLGEEALTAYDSAYQAAIQAAPNFKSRLQQATLAQQSLLSSVKNLQQIQTDLRKAAATSLPLAQKLTERRSNLQQLLNGDSATAPTSRTFDQIFSAPGTTPAPAAQPAPTASADAAEPPGDISRGLTALMDIGGSMAKDVPGLSPTVSALGTAGRAVGGAMKTATGALYNRAASVGNTVAHPVSSLVQLLEAAAAQRRQQAFAPAPVSGDVPYVPGFQPDFYNPPYLGGPD